MVKFRKREKKKMKDENLNLIHYMMMVQSKTTQLTNSLLKNLPNYPLRETEGVLKG